MSCLFLNGVNSCDELDIYQQNGVNTRRFNKTPCFPKVSNYTASLFLMYISETRLPFLMENYSNHFALYSNDKDLNKTKDNIIIVRSETSLIYSDIDAILEYHSISLVKCRKTKKCEWIVSYDDIEFNNNRPTSFDGYYLLCSGEWWYFDKGIILNGHFVEKDKNYSMFIYYELKPVISLVTNKSSKKITVGLTQSNFLNSLNTTAQQFRNVDIPILNAFNINATNNTSQQSTSQQSTSQQSTSQQTTNTTLINNAIPSITLSTIPAVTATNLKIPEPIIRENFRSTPVERIDQNIVPSLFWLSQRTKEFSEKDISYFNPLNDLGDLNKINTISNKFCTFTSLFST